MGLIYSSGQVKSFYLLSKISFDKNNKNVVIKQNALDTNTHKLIAVLES